MNVTRWVSTILLAMKHEGSQVAEWLNALGVTAAVLKYRVPSPRGEPPQFRPLLDGQRALSLIRSRAPEWGVRPDRIGVLGFFLDLKRAGVASELHVYQTGGHGFGMLRRGQPVHDWPARCGEWMRAQGRLAR